MTREAAIRCHGDPYDCGYVKGIGPKGGGRESGDRPGEPTGRPGSAPGVGLTPAAANPVARLGVCPDGRHILCISEAYRVAERAERIREFEIELTRAKGGGRCPHRDYTELAKPDWAQCNDCGEDFRLSPPCWNYKACGEKARFVLVVLEHGVIEFYCRGCYVLHARSVATDTSWMAQ